LRAKFWIDPNEKMFVVMTTRDARQRWHYRYLVRGLVHQVLAD